MKENSRERERERKRKREREIVRVREREMNRQRDIERQKDRERERERRRRRGWERWEGGNEAAFSRGLKSIVFTSGCSTVAVGKRKVYIAILFFDSLTLLSMLGRRYI